VELPASQNVAGLLLLRQAHAPNAKLDAIKVKQFQHRMDVNIVWKGKNIKVVIVIVKLVN
jgi:hypothetical protein